MKNSPRILAAVMGLFLAARALGIGRLGGRAVTHDVAFPFRMGNGFPGDVNRARPMSIVPGLNDSAVQAVRFYGDAVLVNVVANANTIRGAVAGDGSATPAKIYGVAVRPYPIQQQAQTSVNNSPIGAAAVPPGVIVDTLRLGFIMVKLPAGAVVTKDGQAFVWAAATSGGNIQGQFVAAASGANTITVLNARYAGPADAQGNVELELWAA
jgi:hypothetical protein